MRIISGKYRSRAILPPRNFKARPTTDFAKEGLFNILNNYIDFESTSLLDLFAGTGSISYEFASRGCTQIDAVESDVIHAGFIKKTVRELAFEGFRTIQSDVFVFLRHARQSYEVVFADPPYNMEGIEHLPGLILDNGFVKADGWLILEHSASHHFTDLPHFSEERHYGSVHFSFFRI